MPGLVRDDHAVETKVGLSLEAAPVARSSKAAGKRIDADGRTTSPDMAEGGPRFPPLGGCAVDSDQKQCKNFDNNRK